MSTGVFIVVSASLNPPNEPPLIFMVTTPLPRMLTVPVKVPALPVNSLFFAVPVCTLRLNVPPPVRDAGEHDSLTPY